MSPRFSSSGGQPAFLGLGSFLHLRRQQGSILRSLSDSAAALLPPPTTFKDSRGYIEPTWMIQDNLILRSAISNLSSICDVNPPLPYNTGIFTVSSYQDVDLSGGAGGGGRGGHVLPSADASNRRGCWEMECVWGT